MDGRYDILRPLGRGGMGEVVLARQVNLDRLVVIKRVLEEHSVEQVRALLEEARVAASLSHPNIVSILDVGGGDGRPVFVAMEYVQGVTLRDAIVRMPGGLPLDAALAIAVDVLRGLAHAHTVRRRGAVGVVHRDVKPRNIMVTFAGHAKLIDFGISRWLGETGWEPAAVSGTLGYMAPEQAEGRRVDPRADQYSFAVTLREMLATPDPELEAILARACAADPDARFDDCAALQQAIEQLATARGIAISSLVVERWMNAEFADRREALEFEGDLGGADLDEATSRLSRYTGAAGLPTCAEAALTVRNLGDPDDDWLVPSVDRLLRLQLANALVRRFRVVAEADVRLDVLVRREAHQFAADVVHGGARVASVASASVQGACAALAEKLARMVGTRLPELPPDPDELAALEQLGAPTIEALRMYRHLVARCVQSWTNAGSHAARAEALIAKYPGWLHAYVLAAVLHGHATLAASRMLSAAHEFGESARDPNGLALITALKHHVRGEPRLRREILADVVERCPVDVLAANELLIATWAEGLADDAVALARRLHDRHPEAEFGRDLAAILRNAGDLEEVDRVTRRWGARAPENPVAALEMVRLADAAGDTPEAMRWVDRMLTIHAEHEDALMQLFDALVITDRISDASRIADQLLLGSPFQRARGRLRAGIVAVYQGRFSAAYSTLRRAVEENRPLGMQSELLQCLELLRAIGPLVTDDATVAAYGREQAEIFETLVGEPGMGAALRFQIAVGEGTAGERDVDAFLGDLASGVREIVRRRMVRVLAVAGRVPPERAVAAGLSEIENSAASLIAFARCAHETGELELARRSLVRATELCTCELTNQLSSFHTILARFHLARVLEAEGDRDGALREYKRFLRYWGRADRPIAEVRLARQVVNAADQT